MKQGLGTQLRHLIDLLDGDVSRAYIDAGLKYRPRYTPIIRVLERYGLSTIGQIAENAGMTQPAVTQTVSLMSKDGLVVVTPGNDGRQRLVRLSPKGRKLLPDLRACWKATAAAADGLDADLAFPLSQCLANAIEALDHKSFGTRIRDARAVLDKNDASAIQMAPPEVARPKLKANAKRK
jgi:MarR family transcriptional regulator, organic hydroperoxide resistance regulator